VTAVQGLGGFKETAKQKLYAQAVFSGRYRELYYGGAIRGGKSFCVMAVLFVLCLVFPGSRWVIVRRDLPTIRRNVLPVFEKMRLLSGGFMGRVHQDTWTATARNGSQIILFSESLDTDPYYNRWRGLEANGFWLEEANELDERSYHKAKERAGSWIIPRTADTPRPKQPLPYIFLTSNPAGNWVKRDFYTPWKNGSLKSYQFYLPATPFDNPYLTADYLASLEHLPARDYKIFVLGDWDELAGAALEELSERVHLIKVSRIPDHWLRFGSFDWGYRHPFSFGLYAASPDGDLIKADTITGRLMQDAEMIGYILEATERGPIDARELSYCVAGRDAFHDIEARSSMGPTTAERFAQAGIPMIPADVSRIAGLKNLREFTAWQKRGPLVIDPRTKRKVPSEGTPRLRFFDTPGNRRCFEQLVNMILDPDKPEDVLKVDAGEDGQGGDDAYDETRYGVQSRARGHQPEQGDAEGDDQHPGFDYKAKRRRSKKQMPDPDATVAESIRDDPRAGRYQTPRAAFSGFSGAFRMQNPFNPREEGDEDE
jgi:hypothetical protein